MRNIGTTSAITGLLAAALIWSAAGPAVAGPVCNELDLRSPCVRSNDIRANIVLGGPGDEGRLRLRNEDGDTAVQLRAGDANVTNLFSNEADRSNGLVKAWAQIAPDGTVRACWRCNTDPNETRRFNTGSYEVDFTPLSTDIRGRPRSATIDGASAGGESVAAAFLRDRSGDSSTVQVTTFSLVNAINTVVDSTFVLIIY
jgi:hypothetical protein